MKKRNKSKGWQTRERGEITSVGMNEGWGMGEGLYRGKDASLVFKREKSRGMGSGSNEHDISCSWHQFSWHVTENTKVMLHGIVYC